MPGCVPESQLDGFPRWDVGSVGDVVLEDGGDVFFGEDALAVTYQETGLAAAAVTYNDELLRVRGGLGDVCGCRSAGCRHAVIGAVGSVTSCGITLLSGRFSSGRDGAVLWGMLLAHDGVAPS